MNIREYGRGIVLAALATGIVACAAKPPMGPPPKGVVQEAVGSVVHEVTAVDRETRTVTMRAPDGVEFSIVAGEEVRNFDQIDVGDTVRAEYIQSLTFEVKRKGTDAPSSEAITGLGRTKLGAKPGVVAGGQAQMTATIVGIDKDAKTVTLRNAEGSEQTITPRRPEYLDQVAVGDLVTLTYTEVMAISVEELP